MKKVYNLGASLCFFLVSVREHENDKISFFETRHWDMLFALIASSEVSN